MKSRIFDEKEFWNAFVPDLKLARARVLIQSPFVASRRIKLLSKHIAGLASERIPICLFIQEPRNWARQSSDAEASYQIKEFQLAVDMLQSWGAHINIRKDIHAKFAIIDEAILWEGSLNILSHADTKEHMRRAEGRGEIQQVIVKHELADCIVCNVVSKRFLVSRRRGEALPSLAEIVACRRGELQLSQRALARLSGIQHDTVARLESSNSNVNLATLMKITSALNLEVMMLPRLLVPTTVKLLQEKQLAAVDRVEDRS